MKRTRGHAYVPYVLSGLAGFVAGAFVVSLFVWHFGNFIGGRDVRRGPIAMPHVADRWGAGEENAPPALAPIPLPLPPPATTSGGAAGTPIGTRGAGEAPLSPPTLTTIGPDPVAELRDRRLLLPVKGFGRESLRESFHETRGGSRRHEAIDIVAARSTLVVAVEDGKVARLFFSKVGGITLYQFDPSERYVYYYAHLERYGDNLREGDVVKRGQVIGYVGTSGNAPRQTPHLHFAIFKLTPEKHWWEGTPIDPYPILK